jgi:hypothetical protein
MIDGEFSFDPIYFHDNWIGFVDILYCHHLPQSKRNDDLADLESTYISNNIRAGAICINFLFACAIFYKIISISSKSRVIPPPEKAIQTSQQ